MNKKGFTLVEILVVIVIIGAVAMLIVPRISDVFGKSTTKAMKVQENEINASALVYLEDFCKNPIGTNTCPGTISRNENNTYDGYIYLSTLVNNDYIDKVTYQGQECNACIKFTNNEAKTYLSCPEVYTTDGYSSCGN